MLRVTWIDIVLFVLFFQLLTYVPYLFVQKGKIRLSNRMLAAFLLAKALCVTNFISFRLYDTFYVSFPHLFFFGSSFTLLWGPLLYLYTKSITTKNFKLNKLTWLHFSPAVAHLVYMSVRFHFHSTDVKRELLDAGNIIHPLAGQLYTFYLHTSIWIYIVAALILVFKFRRQIKDHYSSIKAIQLDWMLFVLSGFMLKWAVDVWYLLQSYLNGAEATIPLYISRLILFVFINIMIFKGLKNPVIFSGSFSQNDKGMRKSLSAESSENYTQKLLDYIEIHKPFLDPDLTLNDLSERVNIPPRSLSEIINNNIGQNFYDFINDYRIRESQKLLVDTKSKRKTILEILYECGFNSKSSFNTAFKKSTGMTPKDFKKKNLLAA